jgi:nuclear pore complex protein Nup53
VFGYPLERFPATVDYFRSLATNINVGTTDADAHGEIVNCFRLGYYDPADALRAVRKNGEVLGGSWMVGAKFAVGLTFLFSKQDY